MGTAHIDQLEERRLLSDGIDQSDYLSSIETRA